MKLHALYLLFLFGLLGLNVNVRAHSVQVGYCTNCNGDLRIWVEHWHGTENPSSTSMDLQLNVGGVITNISSSPGASVQNTPAGSLPQCFNPIVIFGACSQANTYNDWVAYDFPSLPVGVPISVTILSGNTVFTEDACGMYPASTGTIIIPPPPVVSNVTSCGGAGNTIGPLNYPAGNTWTNDNTSIGLGASGTGNIPAFTPANVTSTQVANITVSNTCFTSSFTITVNPSPNPNFATQITTGTGLICPGEPVVFNNSSTPSSPSDPITSWNWDFGDGSPNSSQQSPTHTYPLSPSSFLVTLTAQSQSGCSSTDTLTVSFGGPTANFIAPPVCEGSPSVFTDLSIPSGTISQWAWDFNNDGVIDNSSQNPNFTFSSPGNHPVKLLITAAGGCLDSTTIPVIVNPVPVANFSATGECLGFTTTFTDLSTILTGSITTWSWDFGDGLGTSTIQNPTYTYTNSGIYNSSLTVTSDSGCTNTYSTNVNVFANPVANFTADTACAGYGTNFTDLSTIGSINLQAWNWDFNADAVTDNVNQNPSYVFPTGAGTYPVALTIVDSNGCRDSTILNISVSPQPTASFVFTNECFGSATTFTDSSNPNGGTISNWSWDFENDGVVDNTLQNPTNGYPLAGTYTAELYISTALGCVDSTTMQVVVDPIPVASFTVTNECLGNANTIVNTSNIITGSITGWAWNFGDGIGISTVQNPSTYTYASSGIYNITLTVTSDSGCINTVIIPTAIYDVPTAVYTPDSVCLNVPATFTDQSAGNGATINQWNWDFGNANSSTQPNTSELYNTEGVYNTQLIVRTTDGCADTTTGFVAIFPMPVAGFTFTDECFGTAVPFTDVSTISNLYTINTINQWAWNFGNLNTSSTQNPSEQYAVDGQYTVQLTVTTDNNCSNTITKIINVWPLPIVDFSPTDVCLNTATQFTDLSGVSLGSNVGWQWDFGDGTPINTSSAPIHTYLSDSSSFTGQLIVTTNYGCVDSVSKSITVYPNPVISFTADSLYGCTPLIVNFQDNTSINAPGNLYAWNWDFGDGATSSDQSPQGVRFDNLSNTTPISHTVTLTVTSDPAHGSCPTTDSIIDMLTIYPKPIASFSFSPIQTDIYDREITFVDQSIIGSLWYWNLGDGETSINQNPIHVYPDSGSYLVTLYIDNSYGCKDTTQQLVKIDPVYAIFIPNTFSPNGDNLNDFFYAKGFGIKQIQTLIFDRWGNLVFEGYQLESKWDGTYKGKLAVTDTYVYKIKAENIFGEWNDYVGRVTLVK